MSMFGHAVRLPTSGDDASGAPTRGGKSAPVKVTRNDAMVFGAVAVGVLAFLAHNQNQKTSASVGDQVQPATYDSTDSDIQGLSQDLATFNNEQQILATQNAADAAAATASASNSVTNATNAAASATNSATSATNSATAAVIAATKAAAQPTPAPRTPTAPAPRPAPPALTVGWLGHPENGNQGTYVVRPGDNLSSIAQRYRTTWQAIFSANRGVIGGNPNLIRPGQTLWIPA